jgi:hypothetical protein
VHDLWDDKPLLVTAKTSSQGHGRYAFAWATPHELPRPQSSPDLPTLERTGGAPVGVSHQEVLFTNRRSSMIRITHVRAIDIRRASAFSGTLLLQTSEGEGQNSLGDLDLDLEPAVLTERTENEEKGQPFFEGRNITLTQGEEHQLSIATSTTTCACTWRLEIGYRYRGSERTVIVPARDQAPFRMTAYAKKYASVYQLTPATFPDWERLRDPPDQP